jgi:hypothetical protein
MHERNIARPAVSAFKAGENQLLRSGDSDQTLVRFSFSPTVGTVIFAGARPPLPLHPESATARASNQARIILWAIGVGGRPRIVPKRFGFFINISAKE